MKHQTVSQANLLTYWLLAATLGSTTIGRYFYPGWLPQYQATAYNLIRWLPCSCFGIGKTSLRLPSVGILRSGHCKGGTLHGISVMRSPEVDWTMR